jgi:uncharacterized protein (UPF0335 family)
MEQLQQIIERIEGLLEEKATTQELIREAFAEAKSAGFDVKVLRKVIALRAMDPKERAEQAAIINMYLEATDDYAEMVMIMEMCKAKMESGDDRS